MTKQQNSNSPQPPSKSSIKGLHAIIEHSGDISHFNCDQLEQLLTEAAIAAGAKVLGANFHDFGKDMGKTGVLMLAESHMSVHTWPENNYAAIDIFICSNSDDDERVPIDAALAVLTSADPHGCFSSQIIRRSVPVPPLKLIDNTATKSGELDFNNASYLVSKNTLESQ